MEFSLQKAGIGKRAAAWLLDGILVCILATGFALLLSVLLGYDSHNQALQAGYDKYEAQYGVSFDVAYEEYETMPEAERRNWDAAYKALTEDESVMRSYSMVISLTVVILSVSILLSVLLSDFLVPLLLGNGQTVGKKMFGLCIVRVDGVRVNTLQLLTRALLGKYTVETMIPVFAVLMIFLGAAGFMGLLLLVAVPIAQIACLCVTKTNSAIHDLMAGTVAVDMASQEIFRSTEELIEYRKRIAAERAARQPY